MADIVVQEMIARTPIMDPNNPNDKHPTFVQDNQKVWALMQPILVGTQAWAYARSYARTRDRRSAIKGIKDHFLGTNTVNNRITEAESKLNSSTYNGEKRRWNFEAYVRLHTEQHAILSDLEDHGVYKGLDGRSKVRMLINGIKTSEMDTIKATIWNDATLQEDFDRAVGLFKSFLLQQNASGVSINIAQVSTSASEPKVSSKKKEIKVEWKG